MTGRSNAYVLLRCEKSQYIQENTIVYQYHGKGGNPTFSYTSLGEEQVYLYFDMKL